MKKAVILLMSMIVILALAGCTAEQHKQASEAADAADNKINIVTTIFPLYDFSRAVTGSRADLSMLVDPGTEIHSFDPTPADIIKIQEADVFIYIGGENDAWVDSILSSIDIGNKKIVRLMDYVEPLAEEKVEGMQGEENATGEVESDEHIWTSPKNAVKMVNAIAEAIAATDPANQQVYRSNAAAYTAEIQKIDDEIAGIVKQEKRKLLVFGDRFPFRYLVEEFGLDYRAAFPGCSSETEVSAGTLAYLIDAVKKNKIPFVYYIEMSNENIAKSIQEQTGAGLLLLHSCQSVSKEDFKAGVTYVSLMEQNAENLRKGLD